MCVCVCVCVRARARAIKIDPTMKSQNATNILFERTKTNLRKSGFFFFFFFLGKNDKGQTA